MNASLRPRAPRYVRQFADVYDELGDQRFRDRYGKIPALVGVGLFGEFGTVQGRRTHEVQSQSDMVAMQTLLDRVWPLQRRPINNSRWITVGQDQDNDVVIAEYTMSSRHCAFAWQNGQFAVADLGSLNGTRVDQRLLRARNPVLIADGQSLTFGRLKVLFFSADAFVAHVASLSETGREQGRVREAQAQAQAPPDRGALPPRSSLPPGRRGNRTRRR